VALIHRIEATGLVIERQVFTLFKKYQLLAAGIIVGLVVLNTLLSDQPTVKSVLGLEQTEMLTEEIESFDFYQLLNQ
jgi:hypothetical protein